MIDIYIDEVDAQVRRVPACEVLVDHREDEPVMIEIDLMGEVSEVRLRMPLGCAEDLFHGLAAHFADAE